MNNDGQHRTDSSPALNNGQRSITGGVVGQESGGEQQMKVGVSSNRDMSPHQCENEGKDYDGDKD